MTRLATAFFGSVSLALSACAVAAPALTDLHIPAGGFVEIPIDGERMRALAVTFSDVQDTNGSVATFRIEAYRGTKLVESQRVTVTEPGGTELRRFTRPFNRIIIRDGEGTVSGTITHLAFCAIQMVDKDRCMSTMGPIAALVATSSTATGQIGANAGGLDNASSNGTPGSSSVGTSQPSGSNTSNGGNIPSTDVEGDTEVADDDPEPGVSEGSGGTIIPGSIPAAVGRGGSGTPDTTSGNGTNGPAAWDLGTQRPTDTDLPFHGENEPITPMESVVVQAGIFASGSFQPSMPWIDQAKLSKSWRYERFGGEVTPNADVPLADNGMPVFPADHDPDRGFVMDSRGIWFGTNFIGNRDVAGTWRLQGYGDTVLAPRINGATILRQTDKVVEFACSKTEPCRIRIVLANAGRDDKPPTLVQLTDGDGRPVSDEQDLANGLITRETWRRAVYGYGDLRMMHASGAVGEWTAPIRFDHFPEMDYAAWGNQGFFVPYRIDFRQNARDAWSDIENGTGMQHVYSPAEARLRAAWEVGAVYHHNFPHLFLEHGDDLDFRVIGQWAEDFERRLGSRVDDEAGREALLSLFNDYELQHVDEFGAKIVENQRYVTNNQVKVEVGNETWNFSWPYITGNSYLQRKAEWMQQRMGWGKIEKGVTNQAVMTGYNLTKTVARLRKRYPAIEWRGVMAVHTQAVSNWRNAESTAPETPSGYFNTALHGLMVGYELFWQDFAQNEGEWAELYAARPEQPGDWFEAHGATYFRIEAKRSDMKTHLGGIAPEELQRRAADRDEWPALRRELLAFFMDDGDRGSVTGPRGLKSGTSSLATHRRNYLALAEHAAVLGMQVGSYEGGSSASPGNYYKNKEDQFPDVYAFWEDFNYSVELALIQAAVHDVAVDAGWMTLADFRVFQGDVDYHIFGDRRSFEDVTPRYCEFARWMPGTPPVAEALVGIENLITPHERCGGLIEYLNSAKANGYYVGAEIPTPDALINAEE